jgi:hypothetical protein
MTDPVIEKPDPWPHAQEALFNIVRAWVREENAEDNQLAAQECLIIMREVNQTEGAPFIFVAELARLLAQCIAKYMAALNEEIPSREDVMAEIDTLELDYIEEQVVLEMEDDEDDE